MDRSIILRAIAAIALGAGLLTGCGEGAAREAVSGDDAPMPEARVSRAAIEKALSAAEEYFQADDLPRAEAILLRLIDRAPGEAAAHELHGQVLLARAADARNRGNLSRSAELAQQAYERYQSVLRFSPPSAGLQHSAGDIAQMAGLIDEALEHYTEAMRLDPTQPRHALFAAQLLSQRGDLDEAEQALKRVLAIDPDEPLAHASLANLAIQREDFSEAMEHIREARAIRPGDVSFRVIHATIHRGKGEPERSLELLLGLPPEQRARWMVASELAASFAMIGQHSSAAEAWKSCFRARPDDPQAWRAALGAAEQLLESGKRRDANRWLQQARIVAPPEDSHRADAQRPEADPADSLGSSGIAPHEESVVAGQRDSPARAIAELERKLRAAGRDDSSAE